MSDYNSSLPVRTETNGDVVAKLVDGTTNTQYLSIDANGLISSKTFDQSGNGIDSQTLVTTQWLQVVTPGHGPASPGTASTYSVLAGGIYNLLPPTLTDGQQASLQLSSSGRLLVDNSSNNDTNYGAVGTNTLRTAAQIGNASGAADFGAGATGAQTLRVVANQGAPNTLANAWPSKITDGTTAAEVTANGELEVNDGLRGGGVYGALTLTTGGTTYEAKVGGSVLTNRKSLTITAMDDMYWGYDSSVTTSTGTPLYKNQQIVFAIDPDGSFHIWLVASGNSKTARITESA